MKRAMGVVVLLLVAGVVMIVSGCGGSTGTPAVSSSSMPVLTSQEQRVYDCVTRDRPKADHVLVLLSDAMDAGAEGRVTASAADVRRALTTIVSLGQRFAAVAPVGGAVTRLENDYKAYLFAELKAADGLAAALTGDGNSKGTVRAWTKCVDLQSKIDADLEDLKE